jgi:cell pole-organizing protein PopZ
MKQNGEPTVEEILASIKQVIARDSRIAFEPPQREPLASAAHADAPTTAAAAAPRAAVSHAEQDDVLDLTDAVPADGSEPAADTDAAAPLLAEGTRAAMRESLAALAAISGPGAIPQIVRSGETSLEGLTRELLRPALTDWLDKNLPALVERMVAAEIARIVGKKG